MIYFYQYANPACEMIPQVFPGDSVMNPFSPHVVPHEFLTIQESSVLYPTNRTAWFNPLAQFEKTPLLYLLQFVASTSTVNG